MQEQVKTNQTSPDPETVDPRSAMLGSVLGNVRTFELLFQKDGSPTQTCKELLLTLPLHDQRNGQHIVESYQREGTLNHRAIEAALQSAFFKPQEARFSFETAADGAAPSPEQLAVFRAAGLVDALRVSAGGQYDAGVIFGGLAEAIDSRTSFLLDQGANFQCVGLLGGKRAIIESREGPEVLTKILGDTYYNELHRTGQLPRTEYELMVTIWEAYCQRSPALRNISVVAINSDLRLGKIKEAPGTPETVVDFANTLTSGFRVPGLDAAPSSFLLSSSQPHAIRQREDFLASMTLLGYPGLSQVDVVGFARNDTPALKLYGTEFAKLVHAQFLSLYGHSKN